MHSRRIESAPVTAGLWTDADRHDVGIVQRHGHLSRMLGDPAQDHVPVQLLASG